MIRRLNVLALAGVLLALAQPALAQSTGIRFTLPGGATTPVTAANPLPVTSSGGTAPATGAGTAASAARVTYASDGATVPVSASALPLPSGAATSANQTTLNGYVDGIEALLTTPALPTGAATSAAQTTAQTSFSSIVANTAATPKLGQTTRTPVWASGQHLTTSTTSARTTALTGTEAMVSCSSAGYIIVGNSSVVATAGAGSLYLGAGVPFTVQITTGQYVAAILPTGTGTCSVIPVA